MVQISSQRARSVDRRMFHRQSLGLLTGLALGLSGCGGGTAPLDDEHLPLGAGSGVPGVMPRATPVPQMGGLFALPPGAVGEPVAGLHSIRSLNVLADGRIALAWTEAAPERPQGPWRLRLRTQGCAGACAGRTLTLVQTLADPEAAVTTCPDGHSVVAWREREVRRAAGVTVTDHRLLLQRFDPEGLPLDDPQVVEAYAQVSGVRGEGRSLGSAHLDRWLDGSWVLAWTDVHTGPVDPVVSAEVRVRRYHANGWPVDAPRTLSTRSEPIELSLSVWPETGGYAITPRTVDPAPGSSPPLLADLWNPLPAESLAGLLPGSLFLSLGICGTVLFASRFDPRLHTRVYTRETFSYEGQPSGRPVVLPGLPLGAVALRDIEFVILQPGPRPGAQQAQRMDKYGRLLGQPVPFPSGLTARLADGSLVVAWGSPAEGAPRQLWLQRFSPTRVLPAPPLATG